MKNKKTRRNGFSSVFNAVKSSAFVLMPAVVFFGFTAGASAVSQPSYWCNFQLQAEYCVNQDVVVDFTANTEASYPESFNATVKNTSTGILTAKEYRGGEISPSSVNFGKLTAGTYEFWTFNYGDQCGYIDNDWVPGNACISGGPNVDDSLHPDCSYTNPNPTYVQTFTVKNCIDFPEAPSGEVQGGKIGAAVYPEFNPVTGTAKLGIGTTTPQETLHVVGSGLFEGPVKMYSAPDYSTDAGLYLTTKDYVDAALSGISTSAIFDADGNTSVQVEESANENKIRFDTNNVERMIIDENGNVGIGTTSPNAKLDVNGKINTKSVNFPALSGTETDPWSGDSGYSPIIAADYKYRKYAAEISGQYYETQHTGTWGNFFRWSRGSSDGDQKIAELRGNDIDQHFDLYNATIDEVSTRLSSTGNSYFAAQGGNVGIGTTTPSAQLEVKGGVDGELHISSTGEGNSAHLGFNTPGAEGRPPATGIVAVGLGANGYDRSDLHFVLRNGVNHDAYSIANDTRMIIKNSGNVGIGTTDPVTKLDVKAGAAGNVAQILKSDDSILARFRDNSGRQILQLGQGGDSGWAVIGGSDYNDAISRLDLSANQVFVNGALYPQGTTTWTRTGDATSTSAQKSSNKIDLEASLWDGSGESRRHVQISHKASTSTNLSSRIAFDIHQGEAASALVERMSILENGNVGIGTTDPSEKLDVAGNVVAEAFLYSSDERLKENIRPMVINSLENILKVQTADFEWKSTGKTDTGFIAQDLEQYFPQFVHTNPETGYKTVNYSKMVVPLVESVQQLSAEVELLRAEIEALKAEK
jgi:hypothetical protein